MSKSRSSKSESPMSSVDAPPPPPPPMPLFRSVIDALTEGGYHKDADLVAVLSNSDQFETIVSKLKEWYANEHSDERKKWLVALYVDVLNLRPEIEQEVTAIKLFNTYMEFVVDCQLQLINYDVYVTMKSLMSKLAKGLVEGQEEDLFNVLKSHKGTNCGLLMAVLATARDVNTKELLEQLVDRMGTDVSSVLALATFFESHNINDVEQVAGSEWEKFGKDQKFCSLFKELVKQDKILQHAAIDLWISAFQFLGVERAVAMYSEVQIDLINMVKDADKSLAKHALQLYLLFPTDGTVPQSVQLETLLQPLMEIFDGFDSDYSKLLVKYISERKDFKNFRGAMLSYLRVEASARNAFYVAACLDMLKDSEIVDAGFPRPPIEDIRICTTVDCLKWALKAKKHTELVFCAGIRHMFEGITKESIRTNEALKTTAADLPNIIAIMYSKYPVVFGHLLLEGIKSLENLSSLQIIAKSLARVFAELKRVAKVTIPEKELFCEVFAKLFVKCLGPGSEPTDREILFYIFKVFSPEVKEIPKEMHEYVDLLVPSEFCPLLQKIALDKSKENIYELLLWASLPGLAEHDLKACLNDILKHDEKEVDLVLYRHYLTIAAARYLQSIFKIIADLKLGDKKNTTLAECIKKNQIKNVLKAVRNETIALITVLAKPEMTEAEQSQCYATIAATLPPEKKSIQKVKDVAKLVDVFPLLAKVKPPMELSKRLVGISLFAECIPILMKAMEGTTDLSLEIVDAWAGYLASTPKAYPRNELIINIAYEGAASRQRTLVLIKTLELCKANFNNQNEEVNHAFADFAWWSAYKAKRFACRPAPDVLISFLVKAAPLVVSKTINVRLQIVRSIYKLFGVTRVHNLIAKVGSVLSVPEIIHQATRLYKKVCLCATPEFGDKLMEEVTSFQSYPIEHAVLMRAVIGSRAEFTTSRISCAAINNLILHSKNLGDVGMFHFEKAILKYAKRSMGKFLPILIDDTDKNTQDLRSHLLKLILASEDHKTVFLVEFHKLLIECSQKRTKDWMFTILPEVVESERTADISADVFGYVLCELFIWMAIAHSFNLADAVPKINGCLNQLLSKTRLGKETVCSLALEKPSELSESLRALAQLLINVEFKKLNAIHERVAEIISSETKSLCLVFGMFCAHMIVAFNPFNNSESIQYCEKMAGTLASIWSVAMESTTRLTLAILKPETLRFFNDDIKKAHYERLLDALLEAQAGNLIYDTVVFVIALMKSLPDDLIKISLAKLLNVVRRSWSDPVSVPTFEALERYVHLHPDIRDFLGDVSPNLRDLWLLSVHENKDIQARGYGVMDQLKQGDMSVGHTVASFVTDKKAIVDWGIQVLQKSSAQAMIPDWYNFVADISTEVKYEEYEKIYDFESELMKISLLIVQNDQHPCKDRSIEVMGLLLE